MTVVSNTSPILNLACVGELRLLHGLYGRILVPRAVMRELSRLKESNARFRDIVVPNYIETVAIEEELRVRALRLELDEGEAAAISLAVDFGADLLLIDERRGRNAARRMGIRPFGLLGVLMAAKRRGILSDVRPILAQLEETAGFWIDPALRGEVLSAAGEI